MKSTVSQTPNQQIQQLAQILARGLIRLNSTLEKPPKNPANKLETVSKQSVTVHTN